MTMKKKLAILICSMPLAVAPIAFAQTGGATEGTTSPQSGSQTDMGTDGAPNSADTNGSTSGAAGGANGASNAGGTNGTTGTSGSGASDTSSSPSTTGAADTATEPTPDASSGDSFQSKLKGKSVYNENDEKVGDVKDVVMTTDGKVTHVILGVGGFIGVGEHTVAIPYDEINTAGDRPTLQGYTKEQLKDMPAYEYPREERVPAPASSPAAPMGATR